MAVIIRLRPVSLAKLQILLLGRLHAHDRAVAVGKLGGHSHDLRIEIADTLRGAGWYLELDIGDAERDTPKAHGVRLIAAYAIAPWTGRLDVIVVLPECEGRAVQFAGDGCEPVKQRLAAGNHDPGM